MGHRANYVLIEKGKARAFYDQWGALGSTLCVADGLSSCRKLAELGEKTDELMDWAFAEGGFLLDYDEKKAIVFGYPETSIDDEMGDMMSPDALESMKADVAALEQGIDKFFEHCGPGWKGWTLVWDSRGTDAFAEHLKARGITSIKTQPASAPAQYANEAPIVVVIPGGPTTGVKKGGAKKKSGTKKKKSATKKSATKSATKKKTAKKKSAQKKRR